MHGNVLYWFFSRYESMFEPQVATALFSHICKQRGASAAHKSTEEVQAMAAEFALQKRQRASQVNAEQRQALYVQLAAEMDALPAIFVRRRDCQVVPLMQGSSSSSKLLGVSKQ
jgi:hypothetical protein